MMMLNSYHELPAVLFCSTTDLALKDDSDDRLLPQDEASETLGGDSEDHLLLHSKAGETLR